MSPQCTNCGSHVSPEFHRVRSDNDGTLHACPNCTSPATLERDAAGVSSAYQVRTNADGKCISTDGGEDS